MEIEIAIFFYLAEGEGQKTLLFKDIRSEYYIQYYAVKHYAWQHNVKMRIL